MDFIAIDETKLLVLTGVGALLTIAGLVLIFRDNAKNSNTRIEFLGLKFQAASVGLVVLLSGVTLILLSVLIPLQSRDHDKLEPPVRCSGYT